MCMMIHHPAEAEPFDRVDFADFHWKSPHGFGVIWRSPSGEIRSRRGLLDLDESWPLYRTLYANGCKEMLLHWRYRTAGPVNTENCHPIAVPGTGLLMMHNGASIGPSTATKSDSVVFAEKLGTEIGRSGRRSTIDDPVWLVGLNRRIGSGNKLALWHQNDQKPILIGESGGLWWRGRWYSNTYAWTVPNEAWPKRERSVLDDREGDFWPRYERKKFDWHRLYG